LKKRPLFAAAAFPLVILAALCVSPRVPAVVDALPDRLRDDIFWRLVEDFSEPGGYFRSDNLISNEDAYQHVIPALNRRLAPGGVYIGVGPDQNFTYIVAVRPRMAFIVDIRRQNMLLHLMYKALVELSSDRASLLSRLFSRKRPAGASQTWSARALFDAYQAESPSAELFRDNLSAMTDRLVRRHGFALSTEDLNALEYVYRAFYIGGPDMRYSFPRSSGGRWFPSYAELMMETDSEGEQHSYLATERNYQTLRAYEMANLIVPVVGDFWGDKALTSLGRYLRARGAMVTLFYTSNVEQYLFQTSAWRKFFANVAELPVNERSTVIRSFFNYGLRYGATASISPPGRSAMLTDSIPSLLSAVRSGRVQRYYDVIERSH
jgi:hypothetical protein